MGKSFASLIVHFTILKQKNFKSLQPFPNTNKTPEITSILFQDYYDDYDLGQNITTTEESETTTEIETTISTSEKPPEEDLLSFEAKLGLSIGGAVLLLLILCVAIFMFMRGRRRKIQGTYNPAYLEQIQSHHKKVFTIPLPQPERLI